MSPTKFDTITPSLKPVPPNFREYELLESISYDVGAINSGDRVTAPKGFITDFASVPRALWWLYPPMGRYSPAAIIHDYLYVTQTRSRAQADKIFLEAMKVLGVPWHRRTTMYSAVRVGGYFPWKKRTKDLNN